MVCLRNISVDTLHKGDIDDMMMMVIIIIIIIIKLIRLKIKITHYVFTRDTKTLL